VKAVAHASPMAALHLLYVHSLPEYGHASCYYEYVTQVDPPQYVAFYVQGVG
jgi:hypothetical protein